MLKRIAQTIFLLIVSPQKGWGRVVHNRIPHQDFINNFLFPIFGFISLTTFAGAMWMGTFGGLQAALKAVIVVVASLFGGFYTASYAVGEIYLKHEQLKDPQLVQQFVGYSSAVVYLLYLVMPLLPGLELLWLFIFYSFYLVYSGVAIFLNIPEKNRALFTLGAFAAVVFSPVLINFLLSLLVD